MVWELVEENLRSSLQFNLCQTEEQTKTPILGWVHAKSQLPQYNFMIKFLKSIWYFFIDKCECGGYFEAWDEKKAFCNKCGKRDY